MNRLYLQRIIKYALLCLVMILGMLIFYNLYSRSDIRPHTLRAEAMGGMLEEGIGYFLANNTTSYPIWQLAYLFVKKCMMLFAGVIEQGGEGFQRVCATATCTLGIGALYLACCHVYGKTLPHKYRGYACIFAVLLVLTGPYYVKPINASYYAGSGIIVPWHNPTTIAVYPLAILCYGIYLDLAQGNTKKWILFSVLLFISGFAKPSFYQMAIPGIAFFCLLELILSKGKKIMFCFKSFVSVLPTCFLLFIQHKMEIRVPETTVEVAAQTMGSASQSVSGMLQKAKEVGIAGIGIEWMKVQKIYTSYPFLSLLLMWVFPLFVLSLYVFYRKKNIQMCLSICLVLSGTLQYTFLYLQMRPDTGDFAWGYYISLACLFIGCVSYFFDLCESRKWKLLKWAGMAIYFGHVLLGTIYSFKLMCPGFSYVDSLF